VKDMNPLNTGDPPTSKWVKETKREGGKDAPAEDDWEPSRAEMQARRDELIRVWNKVIQVQCERRSYSVE